MPRTLTAQSPPVSILPTDFTIFTGLSIPDPITFAVGPKWLNRAPLYPRQATLLKIIFLREDLFTDYDYEVVQEWEDRFFHTGRKNGIVPDILKRMRFLKAMGYPWFREVLLVMGRRAGKGHIAAISMAYVLWSYMAKGDPQDYYGINRDKQLACFIYAGKKEQARVNLWKDLTDFIKGAPCFSKYISRPLGESLSIFAPSDFLRIEEQRSRGIVSASDMATFIIQPKEATLMSGRGPTSYCLDPETPVLTANLEWIPIGKVSAGDELVGFDENPERPGAQRKMRRTVVQHAWRVRKPAKRLTFTDGSSVTCSSEHRWLIKGLGRGGTYRWTTTDRLHPGSFIRHLVDPWEEVWEGVAPRGGLTPSGVQRKDAFKTIALIEELPEQELVDIETTTRTFIANGLFSHNCQAYDEMAHQVSAGGAARSAEEIYTAATPALDQFKKDAFIIEPSSPWQMVGQFYQNWLECLELDEEGEPVYPEKMMIQLESWEIYRDWQHAHILPLFPEGFTGDLDEYADIPHPRMVKRPIKAPPQEYDEGMRRLEKSNPDTFKVERRAHWQAVMDAYLDPEKVDKMFEPWPGEKPLQMQERGILSKFYKGHADPSLVNANFAIAIAHPVTVDGIIHCVFDFIHHFEPSDFENNTIDYLEVEDFLWERVIEPFKPDEFTFDQFNSASTIAKLNSKIRQAQFPKSVVVYEKTATAPHNWERAECFKVGLNQGWIHAPLYDLAVMELKFLQLKNGNKVEKQDAGPVQTKDIADCLMECAWTILGEQVGQWTQKMLKELPLAGAASSGFDPYARQRPDNRFGEQLGSLARTGALPGGWRGGNPNPARNPLANRSRGQRGRGGRY